MQRKVPWWMPRTRAMRGVCITVALLIGAADAFVFARHPAIPGVLGLVAGISAGFLLCTGTWPRR